MVDEMLLDAGHSTVPELRAVLMSLGSLAELPAPAPGAELAALMAGPHNDLSRRRWLRKHRPAVVGIAVLTGMGLGISGVAASSPVPQALGAGLSVQQLVQDWTQAWTVPVASRQSPAPGASTLPAALPPEAASPEKVPQAAFPAAPFSVSALRGSVHRAFVLPAAGRQRVALPVAPKAHAPEATVQPERVPKQPAGEQPAGEQPAGEQPAPDHSVQNQLIETRAQAARSAQDSYAGQVVPKSKVKAAKLRDFL
ncbi:hypothetical protein [Pseudarthrobacter sp. N5]|uniref:hypothetical protein n=1 Tax=Pseudarthrobacter sp. N5 TaxID=3418416 RepID=UPI003CF90AF7